MGKGQVVEGAFVPASNPIFLVSYVNMEEINDVFGDNLDKCT